MSQISRTQAYAKLVLLMVDHGLPAPKEISVYESGGVAVNLSYKPDFDRWVDHFSAPLDEPFIAPGSGNILHEGTVEDWYGYHLRIVVHVRATPPEPPVTDDLTSVREAAGAVSE